MLALKSAMCLASSTLSVHRPANKLHNGLLLFEPFRSNPLNDGWLLYLLSHDSLIQLFSVKLLSISLTLNCALCSTRFLIYINV